MSLNFNSFNIGSSNDGGGGGTTNHAALSNLDYAKSGHTGFMSSENYIPKNTTFTIKSDGTGDFATLSEAVNFINGKWSNGQVTISIGAGTFDNSSAIVINGINFNIPNLSIEGAGVSSTTLKWSNLSQYGYTIQVWGKNSNITLKDLTIDSVTGGINYDFRSLEVSQQGSLTLWNVVIKNTLVGVHLTCNANLFYKGTNSIQNSAYGIKCIGSRVSGDRGVGISFDTITTAMEVLGGGFIQLYDLVYNETNVTNKTNVTVGQWTSDGFISFSGW